MKYYIGDWHYGHRNVIKYDNRPFGSIDEMNKELIKRWNDTVTDNDTVYILGDMFFNGSNSEICRVLETLKGHKILIRENHDRKLNAAAKQYFDGIFDYLEITDGNEHIVLSHYPILAYKNQRYGWLHFYAHVHNSDENILVQNAFRRMQKLHENSEPLAFNVGAMMLNYTPQTLDSIRENAPKSYLCPVCSVHKNNDKYWLIDSHYSANWFIASSDNIKDLELINKDNMWAFDIMPAECCTTVKEGQDF